MLFKGFKRGPILSFSPILMRTAVCDRLLVCVRAVLSQEIDGQENICRIFTPLLIVVNVYQNRREIVYYQEGICFIVITVEQFRHCLYKTNFCYEPLFKVTFKFQTSRGQVDATIQECDFEICHRKGILNENVDVLSRKVYTKNADICSMIEKKYETMYALERYIIILTLLKPDL